MPWRDVPTDREPASEVAARLDNVADELERATLELRTTVKVLRGIPLREEHVR